MVLMNVIIIVAILMDLTYASVILDMNYMTTWKPALVKYFVLSIVLLFTHPLMILTLISKKNNKTVLEVDYIMIWCMCVSRINYNQLRLKFILYNSGHLSKLHDSVCFKLSKIINILFDFSSHCWCRISIFSLEFIEQMVHHSTFKK